MLEFRRGQGRRKGGKEKGSEEVCIALRVP